MIKRTAFALFGAIISFSSLAAGTIPDGIQQYIVKKGDTLWGISKHFTTDPQQWAKLWSSSSTIRGANTIYPGDKIEIVSKNGQSILKISGRSHIKRSTGFTSSSKSNVVKLSPKVRIASDDRPIPTISAETVKTFLNKDSVFPQQELEDAPYIVAMEKDRLITSAGQTVYVKNLPTSYQPGAKFSIYRPSEGEVFKDPVTKETLGYGVKYIGKLSLNKVGDLAELTIEKSKLEVMRGDKIFPAETFDDYSKFDLKWPKQPIHGYIISGEGVAQVGQYQMVVLNIGARNGVQKGDVLWVKGHQREVPNEQTSNPYDKVIVPGKREGDILVYKVFEKISYAMVMSATSDIHIGDVVAN